MLLRWTYNQLRMASDLITGGENGRPGHGDGLKDINLSCTTNPHYWATELNVPDSTVKGFLKSLRKKNILKTTGEGSMRFIDPDTKALVLDTGDKWNEFVAEFNARKIRLKENPHD